MSVDRSTIVFFDASCLIAAGHSPSGGSGFLLTLCARGFLRAAVSQPVLLEAETNLLAKFPPSALSTHRRHLAATPLTVAPVPRPRRAGDTPGSSTRKTTTSWPPPSRCGRRTC